MTWVDDFVTFAVGGITSRVREELYARGVTDEQIDLYRIGYVNRHLPALEGAEDFMTWSYRGSKLDDMLVFPMTTQQGAVKGLQFRHLARDKKGYTDYFLSQEEPVYFGLAQAIPHIWRTESAYLVEGVFDLFPIQRHFPAVFPTMGAKVTLPLVRVLRRLVRRVWLGYDMDPKGRKACFDFIREYGKEFEAHVVSYPKIFMVGTKELIKDPGDLWECWGDARVKEFVNTIVGT